MCREKRGGMGAEYRRYFSVSPVIWPGLLPLYERKVSVLWGNLTWSSVSTEGAAALSRSGCRAQGSRGLCTGYVRVMYGLRTGYVRATYGLRLSSVCQPTAVELCSVPGKECN